MDKTEKAHKKKLQKEREERLHSALLHMVTENCGESLISVTGRLIFRFDDGTLADVCVMAQKGASDFGTTS